MHAGRVGRFSHIFRVNDPAVIGIHAKVGPPPPCTHTHRSPAHVNRHGAHPHGRLRRHYHCLTRAQLRTCTCTCAHMSPTCAVAGALLVSFVD